jgi:hypothetical protein
MPIVAAIRKPIGRLEVITRDFYRKMRCSQLQFQENCQEILLEIASKCFQLDVIIQQVLLALSQISSF